MTTNLKISTDDKAKVVLAPVIGSTTNSTLTIRVSDNFEAWNNDTAAGVNGKFDIQTVGFPVDGDATHNVIENEILYLEITGPTDILTTFRNLILLKDDVKNIGTDALNRFEFQLVIDKDLTKQTDHWNITNESALGDWDRTIKLSEADFGGVLNESKIIIDDVVYHDDPNNTIHLEEDRRDQKQALLDLEKLLRKDLPTKYGVKYSDKVDLNELNFEKGPDVNLIDPSADLGDPPSTTNPVPRNGL
jgi:hypothetical protein